MIKHIDKLFKDKRSKLSWIYSKLEEQKHLNAIFHAIYDSDIGKNCYVVDITGHTLNVLVNSQAWASMLRYNIPNIIKIINTQPEFRHVQKIKFSINSFIKK